MSVFPLLSEPYQTLLSATPNVILLFEEVNAQGDLRLVICNSAAAQTLMLSEISIGQVFSASDSFISEYLSLADLRLVRQTLKSRELRIPVKRPDGKIRWLLILLQPIDNYILITGVDITRQYKAETELQQQMSLLQSVLDASQDSIMAVDAQLGEDGTVEDFIYVMMNQAGEQTLQRPFEEIRGKGMLEIVPAIKETGLFDIYRQVWESGKPQQVEQHYNADGVTGWFRLSVVRRDTGLLITVTNITGLRQAEQQATRQAELLQSIMDASQAAIIAFDAVRNSAGAITDFQFVLENQASRCFRAASGFDSTPNAAMLKTLELVDACSNVIQTGEPFIQMVPVNKGDYEFSVVRHGDGIVMTIEDKTVEKRAENALLNALEREQEINAIKSRFVGLVSHEFRTPMATILSSAEIIEMLSSSGPLDLISKIGRHTVQITDSINRLNKLISEILIQERLQSGQIIIKPVEFDVVALCREVTEKQSAHKRAHQSIRFSSNVDVLPVVLDQTLLEHSLDNLISNALKYSVTSTNPVEVTLIKTENSIEISVVDYGIGIPSDELGKIGNNFFRASNVKGISGTGLGLSLVKQFVRMQGGEFNLNSVYGESTYCLITLPLRVE